MECLLEQSWDRWPVPSSRWLSTLSAASPLSSTQTTVYKQCSHLQLKRHCSFPAERYSCFCNLVTVVEGQMQSRKKGNHKDNRTLSALVWSFTEDLSAMKTPETFSYPHIWMGTTGNETLTPYPSVPKSTPIYSWFVLCRMASMCQVLLKGDGRDRCLNQPQNFLFCGPRNAE